MITQNNYVEHQTPQFRRLADDQLKRLHHASLEILDRTGVCLYDQEALDLMREAGLTVDEGNRVRVPPALIEWALSVAPRNGIRSCWTPPQHIQRRIDAIVDRAAS